MADVREELAEKLGHRLSDIVFFCERTAPVDGKPDEDYVAELKRFISKAAKEAQSHVVALRSPAQGTGEWVLVPKEPTDEMIASGSEGIDGYYNGTKDAPFEGSVAACYRAMLSAAPASPSQQDRKEWRCFTCDEVFTDEAKARIHFGDYKGDVPTCRMSNLDVCALRMSRDAFSKKAEDAERALSAATPAPFPMVTEEELVAIIGHCIPGTSNYRCDVAADAILALLHSRANPEKQK